MSDPKSHQGAAVDIVGQVFAGVERDEKGTYFQMWADPKNSNWNTIVAIADPTLQVADGDFVHVQGTVRGEFKGKNSFGADVSAVQVVADSVAKASPLTAASPALNTFSQATNTQFGITLTVRKVEFADDETRVFVSVINKSNAAIHLYSSSVTAVSGGLQVDSTYSADGYPQLSDGIEPGARSNGVIVFPKMNPSKPLRLTFEGSSDDSNIGDYGSLKWIFTWA